MTQTEQATGEPRFGMLGPIQAFALEQLAAGGELDVLRQRHLHWIADLAAQLDAATLGSAEAAWIARVDAEHDNLFAALTCCEESAATHPSDARIGMAIVVGCWPFWDLRAYGSEGLEWHERMLRLDASPGPERVRALAHAGFFASRAGDERRALQLLEASLGMSEAMGTMPYLQAILWLAVSCGRLGNYPRALELVDAGRTILRSTGEPEFEVMCSQVAALIYLGHRDYERAEAEAADASAYLERRQDWATLASAISVPFKIAMVTGDTHALERRAKRQLEISRRSGYLQHEADALVALARVAAERGQSADASRLVLEGLALARRGGAGATNDATLYGQAAIVAAGLSHHAEAAMMFGALQGWLAATGYDEGWIIPESFAGAEARCRSALGDAVYEQAFAAGRGLRLVDAAERIRAAITSSG